PLRLLLEEAGVERGGTWMLAEGADAAAMSRSIPMAKALDDALLALFQNGERLRPENGYPVRLFLPGWEGNMSVKWLRRLKVVPAPSMTKDETSRYTDLQADGETVRKSRAIDDAGNVQPEREKFIAEHGTNAIFHCNAIQAWSVAATGEVKHVYA